MSDYFSNLPIVPYANQYARNILTKVAFSDSTKNNQFIYYPFTISEEVSRADVLSHKYYDDSSYAWLIYLTNSVVDPYLDMGLNNDDFDKYIVKKYGSQESAVETIAFWRNDWVEDDSILSISQYNILPSSRRKYYKAQLDYNGIVSSYVRKNEDWVVNTNQIASINYSINGTGSFAVGEKVKQITSGSIVVSEGIVDYANSTSITIKHIFGEVSSNSNLKIVSTTSNTNANTMGASIIQQVIPIDELVYWSPVSYYDFEVEENNRKKNIKLLDNRYVTEVESEIKRSFSG